MAAPLDFLRERPFDPGELAARRLAWSARAAGQGSGAHLRRRRGSSLTFRDFADWAPGDELRHVDWVASARAAPAIPGAPRLLRRAYETEAAMRLVVSVDDRASLRWPQDPRHDLCMPGWRTGPVKLILGLWLAAALAAVAAAGRDRSTLHRLFAAEPVLCVAPGPGAGAAAAAWGQRLLAQPPPSPAAAPALAALRPVLSAGAAATWVIVTDALFGDPDGALARAIARARRAHAWVMLVWIDSWPAEAAAIRAGSWRLYAKGSAPTSARPADLAAAADPVAPALAAHVRTLVRRAGLGLGDVVHWPLEPDALVDPAAAARRFLDRSGGVARLFARDAARA